MVVVFDVQVTIRFHKILQNRIIIRCCRSHQYILKCHGEKMEKATVLVLILNRGRNIKQGAKRCKNRCCCRP